VPEIQKPVEICEIEQAGADFLETGAGATFQ
jgi:hypothetical protein